MKQTTLRTLLAAAVVAAAVPQARAGWGTRFTVGVTNTQAWGETNAARHSDDDVQRIGCGVTHDKVAEKTQVKCLARNSDSEVLSCTSYDVDFVPLIASIGDYAYIAFTCQGPNLVKLTVDKYSNSLP
jgi:hypothetical protein